MKRSEINNYLESAIDLFEEYRFPLPEFAYMTPEEVKTLKASGKSNEIFECNLGWDVTDFGSSDFYKKGLLLFTVRNGKVGTEYTKPYAEKLMVVEVGQVTPYHYHTYKQEDIINRGGGNLIIQAYNSDENNEKLKTDVNVSIDGTVYTFKAGERIVIKPGCSICLPQKLFHTFYGEEQSTIVGEVSMVNDDNEDNTFYGGLPRFSEIIEDEEPIYLLAQDYDSI